MNKVPSSRVARYAAFSLDFFILGIVHYLITVVTGLVIFSSNSSGLTPVPSLSTSLPLLLVRLLVTPLYFWLSTYFYGKTLGKKFFDLEVVDEKSGGRLNLGRSFIREIPGKVISSLLLGIGYLWILWDKRRQGWHDKLAHDVVIQKVPLAGGKKIIAYILFTIGIILPIIAVVGVLASVLLLAINPTSQLQKAELQRQMLQQQYGGTGTPSLQTPSY